MIKKQTVYDIKLYSGHHNRADQFEINDGKVWVKKDLPSYCIEENMEAYNIPHQDPP